MASALHVLCGDQLIGASAENDRSAQNRPLNPIFPQMWWLRPAGALQGHIGFKSLQWEHSVSQSQDSTQSAEATNSATLKPDRNRLDMVSFTKIILWKEKKVTIAAETHFMCGLKRVRET